MLDSSLNKLENGKYYDVTRKRDDFKYTHLKLIEVQYREIESVLYFINDDGHKIALYYDEIWDISESKLKEEQYSETLYFKDKLIYIKNKRYCIKEIIQKNFYLSYNNCIIDGIEWIEEVPHLRVFIRNDQVKYINMLFIEDISDAK